LHIFDRLATLAQTPTCPSAFSSGPSHQCVPSIIVLPSPRSIPSEHKNLNKPSKLFLMLSTRQSTSPTSTIQSIIDALADYTKVTGIDLSKDSFAAAIEHLNSPEDVLELLQEREKAFKEYRDGNRGLISCLRPTVNVIQAFSGILGEAVSLVSHTCHPCSSFNDFVRSRFHRQTPCSLASILSLLYVTRMRFSTDSPVTNEYARPLVGLHPVMMPFSSCSSAWGASSNVWRYIRRFHQIR
jgi:fungal STAND N-terminal Goodbye domain